MERDLEMELEREPEPEPERELEREPMTDERNPHCPDCGGTGYRPCLAYNADGEVYTDQEPCDCVPDAPLLNPSPEWLAKMAAAEAEQPSIATGGLAADVGILPGNHAILLLEEVLHQLKHGTKSHAALVEMLEYGLGKINGVQGHED